MQITNHRLLMWTLRLILRAHLSQITNGNQQVQIRLIFSGLSLNNSNEKLKHRELYLNEKIDEMRNLNILTTKQNPTNK
jgi:hypothetical protein